jgi:hypothetical protein
MIACARNRRSNEGGKTPDHGIGGVCQNRLCASHPFLTTRPTSAVRSTPPTAFESLNRSLRKIIKTRGGCPNEEASLKSLFLALRQASKKWTMPI